MKKTTKNYTQKTMTDSSKNDGAGAGGLPRAAVVMDVKIPRQDTVPR